MMVTYAQVRYIDLGDYVWVVCVYIRSIRVAHVCVILVGDSERERERERERENELQNHFKRIKECDRRVNISISIYCKNNNKSTPSKIGS